MSQQRPASYDCWTQQAYLASAPFVPELATTIVQWLNPQPEDLILDLGCGDGVLTAKIKTACSSVTGIDASSNLITAAKKSYGSIAGLSWHTQDCRCLNRWLNFKEGAYNKVFSNAALHWILREPSTRESVLQDVYTLLKPGGTFAFEMGGHGNVAEVHTALIAAVAHQGIDIVQAQKLSPWYFPSETSMRKTLENTGFEVLKIEMEYRPTKLTTDKEGGIEGWTRLMGTQFLDGLDSLAKKEAAIKEVCEVLKAVIHREEDNSMYIGYVRLRALARKPQ
ncbi:MAG: hypothetical protein Q9213_006669 [Squamulea squamosa]